MALRTFLIALAGRMLQKEEHEVKKKKLKSMILVEVNTLLALFQSHQPCLSICAMTKLHLANKLVTQLTIEKYTKIWGLFFVF